MSEPNPKRLAWDNSGDILQGMLDRQVAPTSPQLEFSSDGFLTSEYALSDPASFLGLQFGPDSAVIPHSHLSMLNQWPPHHQQASSPPPQPSLDVSQYHHPRLTSNQDAWNPLQVTGVPVSTSTWGFPNANKLQQTPEGGRKNSTGQHSAISESDSHYNGFHPSDSGYCSRSCTTRSVTTSSYAVDSVSSPFLAPHEHEQEDRASMLDLGPSHCGDTVVDALEIVESPSLMCHDVITCDYPNCPWTGKCPSDKRKHEARHRKLFKCDEPGCTRKEGFGTINDLARHKKCVHKQEPERGPKVLYMCFGRNCPRRGKEWPRLDNFRQHLSRMHNDEDTNELLKRSHDWYESYVKPRVEPSSFADRFSDEATVAASESEYVRRDSGPDLHSLRSPDTPVFRPSNQSGLQPVEDPQTQRRYSTLDSTPSLPAGDTTQRLELPALTTLNLGSTTDLEPSSTSSRLGHAQPDRMENMVSEMATNMVNAMARMMNSSSNDNGNSQRRHSHHMGDKVETLGRNGGLSDQKREIMQKILSAALDQVSGNPEPSQADSQTVPESKSDKKGWIQCEFCTKRTRLRCEMKKHKKRHERPYGCTFEKCSKTFGSKADWKRHENSQHFPLQSWRCTLPDATQGDRSCARLFYDQGEYTRHLKKHHHAEDKEVQAALSKNSIGPHGQSQFWCGFCRDIIPLKGQGLAAWNERFNHIDSEHFKNGERIEDWLLPSGHLTKGAERDEGKERISTHDDGDGEPPADDVSDDETVGSICNSEGENQRDETPMAAPEQVQNLSLRQVNTHFQNNFPMFNSLPDQTNLRKRKFSAPQPSLDYYARADIPAMEKRYKTDDAVQSHYGNLVYCCQCTQGSFSWSYTAQCLYCPHSFCGSCGSERQPRPNGYIESS
ncbi:hypothetical protein BDV30DRAFT_219477 [Aspergillus minisclerotigenes]|uniref:C2H2-type domain-containing protein n=1 Tax=Aspergillus minisclerotigenes TaxID=656917 RepID=A0A5N6IN21_9EURO|nr:hypothetical protein BDV30DRAFT_219477 [Aspergillus minisclerotigenes]